MRISHYFRIPRPSSKSTTVQTLTTTNPGTAQPDLTDRFASQCSTPSRDAESLTDARYEPAEQPNGSNASQSFTGTSGSFLDEIKYEAMVTYIYQQQCSQLWVSDGSGELEGVLLRRARNQYLACPASLLDSTFAAACIELNLQVAMTVNSRAIKTFLAWSPNASEVPLMNGLRVQILSSVNDLTRARKHQFAAFLAFEKLLVVWDDEATNLMIRAKAIESELTQLIWQTGQRGCTGEISDQKDLMGYSPPDTDEESLEVKIESRPTNLLNTTLVAFTLIIVIVLLGLGCKSIAIEIAVDHNFLRLAFAALMPVQIFFTLFFGQAFINCIAQCIGPIKQMQQNSKYYSAICSPRMQVRPLPHITVQCPVYKEGLSSVIAPTVKSIKQAMSTYELQGGTANMFINDDGLQIISEEDRQARIDFYNDHSIGWTARPKHGSEGFIRRGKFKKASNMNFGLMLSCAVEDKLLRYTRDPSIWTQDDEDQAYHTCLDEVLTENPQAWAAGNIRIGDYILLIDSDTRVPADCLLDAVSEMELSPSVGIMQFSSGVMQVVHTYFENGITFFTNLIYTAIRYTVSNGDVSPFVGHNAILRWSAIQQVSFLDPLDPTIYRDREKFWSESHVSEDFDMSLRLQCAGYLIRLASWAGDGFKEGVSLTVYDELARWEKYAYGCNELLFHPIHLWARNGPFTPLFRHFLATPQIRLTSKLTILSYIGTYYALGAAWLLTVFNYFAVGWFHPVLDKYYIDSWRVWVGIILVFTGFGNISLATMRYRSGATSFLAALRENVKWVPLLSVFLGGLSLHVSQALLSHMFAVDMSWGATGKESSAATRSNFFLELPKILRRFKYSILFATAAVLAMLVLATGAWGLVPHDWRIGDFVAIVPLASVAGCHLLLPVVLNPALMVFTW